MTIPTPPSWSPGQPLRIRVVPQPVGDKLCGEVFWDWNDISGVRGRHLSGAIEHDFRRRHVREESLCRSSRISDYGDKGFVIAEVVDVERPGHPETAGSNYDASEPSTLEYLTVPVVSVTASMESVNVTEYAPDGIDPPAWYVTVETEALP